MVHTAEEQNKNNLRIRDLATVLGKLAASDQMGENTVQGNGEGAEVEHKKL